MITSWNTYELQNEVLIVDQLRIGFGLGWTCRWKALCTIKNIDYRDGGGKRSDSLTFLMGFTGQKWQMFTSVTKVCLWLIHVSIKSTI